MLFYQIIGYFTNLENTKQIMELKKNPKADVRRNGSIYFAVGLLLMLVVTYYTINYKSYDKSDIDIGLVSNEMDDEDDMIITEQIKTPPPPPPPPAAPEVIEIVEDDTKWLIDPSEIALMSVTTGRHKMQKIQHPDGSIDLNETEEWHQEPHLWVSFKNGSSINFNFNSNKRLSEVYALLSVGKVK